jgi:peroxiredoxin
MGNDTNSQVILLGDPVPWFSTRSVAGASIELQVNAGRWIVLSFNGPATEPRAITELQSLINRQHLFNEDKLIAFGILIGATKDLDPLAPFCSPTLSFIADTDGALSRLYGADKMPRTVICDPMLRAIANISWDHPEGHANVVAATLAALPDVDASAGVPLTAPALIVPRVFEFPFCDLLVQFYKDNGGSDSGFLLDRDGQTETMIDHRYKSRHDLAIIEPNLRAAIRERMVRRLAPEIDRFFQFKATRMDRYMVSCYDTATGGHFSRHRDNSNLGSCHRRFAASINLNNDYEGCDLIFPEFGRRIYRAPVGGAIVFSCGALHQVTPVTRGKRYAFVPFFYNEEDAVLRKANNIYLRDGEARYTAEHDMLFPEIRAPGIVPEAGASISEPAE